MVLLCDVCATSILISCLCDEGTNKVWAQETVAQHESSLCKHKQHRFFSLQETSMICWKFAKWGTFPPKNPQTQQHWVLFLKLNVRTTSFSDEVTTWHLVGTETAFFLLYPSSFLLLCLSIMMLHRAVVKDPFDYFWKNSHERFALPCLESLFESILWSPSTFLFPKQPAW